MAQEDRSWADGLSQHEFEQEFPRKHPFAGGIMPVVGEYCNPVEMPPSRLIDKIPDSAIENESDVARAKRKEMEEKNTKKPSKNKLECLGCARKFTANIGRISHERRCKDFLNMKTK